MSMKNINHNKKADMALNYIFLIVIGVIVTLVIIMLVTTWASKGRDLFKGFGEKEDDKIGANLLNLTLISDCDEKMNVIQNNARICLQRARNGQLTGSLCNSVRGADGCVYSGFLELDGNYSMEYDGSSSRFDISYDYQNAKVVLS